MQHNTDKTTISKNFNVMMNVGKAKYVINYHNGESAHKDGSAFYDIAMFQNKIKANAFILSLLKDGYQSPYSVPFFLNFKNNYYYEYRY